MTDGSSAALRAERDAAVEGTRRAAEVLSRAVASQEDLSTRLAAAIARGDALEAENERLRNGT